MRYKICPMTNYDSAIEKIIKDYIESKERSIILNKRRLDLEKEYNKQLTMYNGEAKNYDLQQADKIYAAYLEMVVSREEAMLSQARFDEAEEKLKELGSILYEATINAEIHITPFNAQSPVKRPVKVAYFGGQVVVS